ncbi:MULTISPECIES: cold-shock protein [Marinovum]|uniref:Cold shock protein (Beta-ribbon, CspA family) n=1 Tax=Marinovum algicola TaxID=42444 RepID=A0A975W850_9RHOB|nr:MULTISPECIES: cold shock domain-containing protein [Marinovum]AKO96737.1 Cold shock protein [Marinovum algicola DG 898]MDD9739712.1 cold shock domain-containing protein [Marinovum sp. SP66]MDD9745189.1 cold shock domain-containing protein [Marinovum sp. PR37]SEJ03848.1 cold shock protein (beta-ribbon, CspA family) [Marinovum algicola]SLN18432.1 Cold shock protein CspV [Marinovum algicola]
MEQVEQQPRRVEGRVKWFDPLKGFGFVVADVGGPDILLHSNVLRNYGQSSVADGAHVVVDIQETPRGIQAVAVVEIQPPEDDGTPPLADFEVVDPAVIAAAELEPARVKWFDKAKGFGFANVFGRPEDVFLHVEVLRRSGLSDVQSGEALGLRAIEGKRGRMAVEVCPWESALKSG